MVYCYLINLGRAMFHYQQSLYPLLDSTPAIYSPQVAERTMADCQMEIEDAIVHYRTIKEFESLAEMSTTWVSPPGAHYHIPSIALVDGSLTCWFDNRVSPMVKKQILSPIMRALSQVKQHRIPIIGYVSASSSLSVLNFLRLAACTYEYPDCERNCGHLNLEVELPPSQIYSTLSDKNLWANLLAPGLRSGIWKSNTEINDLYEEEQKIHFCGC
ncbi:MAG: DNA double-strand break repair nuclease NurA [Prochloraceae cyanobacterium]|nr:DNA double-strand break repair nuclease NurA [Prochloraceae cyanobacterium]